MSECWMAVVTFGESHDDASPVGDAVFCHDPAGTGKQHRHTIGAPGKAFG
jgi:hypothetical protein